MDLTVLFRTCVKTARIRNKALGDLDQKTDILRKSAKDSNLTKAKEILSQLSKLQHFLNDNRKAYLSVISHFSNSTSITEYDREQIDSNAQEMLTGCAKLIQDLKQECSKRIQTKQLAEHYANVILSLEDYLKEVRRVYAEQKAIRIKRALDNRKISKLELSTTPKPKNVAFKNAKDEHFDGADDPKPIPDKSLPINPEDQLSTEEMQMFESENEFLYNELNSISEEIQQIESKVVHISELQEVFTEKVIQQEKDIERIATTVVGSTENMRDANDQIRQAIQRNAGLRVWILFFLLVMSFSLLFLDWYND